jgi:hypothetical protein
MRGEGDMGFMINPGRKKGEMSVNGRLGWVGADKHGISTETYKFAFFPLSKRDKYNLSICYI